MFPLTILKKVKSKILSPKTHAFMGYEIPVELMLLTGGGPDTFAAISAVHIANLKRWVGLSPDHTVLEIGCGIGRDAIPLTQILKNGRYVGIDIIGRSIEWCSKNISKRHPNFRFVHFDVSDHLHNKNGSIRTTDVRFPLPDHSVDRIILFSVFTHMYKADIEHYLKEFRRVLKPDGLVVATTFVYTEEILAKARSTNLTPYDLRFEFEIEPGCRINDREHPLGAVAYTREVWDEMVQRSGMRLVRPILGGGWSGYYAGTEDGQDVAILAPELS